MQKKREAKEQLQAAGTEYRNSREFIRLMAYQADHIIFNYSPHFLVHC
jgi:hypothetical protein